MILLGQGRLREMDLDVLPESSITQLPTKRHELSRYILEDVLDCPVGSRFLVCISTDAGDFERGAYYSEKAHLIASELKLAGVEAEWWKMSGLKFIVLQGKIERSSHFSDIKMRSVSRRQFVDAFVNGGGDIALKFNNISSWLTIPWRDIIHASSTEVTMTTTIPSECDLSEESEWTVYLRELRGSYY
jgi:hypothetical protein